jgi:hypothetical protein
MIYGVECWGTKGQHTQNMSIAEKSGCCVGYVVIQVEIESEIMIYKSNSA